MNRLNKAEVFLKRQTLAKLMDTNPNYLCNVANRRDLPQPLDDRLIIAITTIIKELQEIVCPTETPKE